VLYGAFRDHLETFLARAGERSADGRSAAVERYGQGVRVLAPPGVVRAVVVERHLPPVAILPCVPGRAVVRLHMLPYGTEDRLIYPTASLQRGSLQRAKPQCDLVPSDVPGTDL